VGVSSGDVTVRVGGRGRDMMVEEETFCMGRREYYGMYFSVM
jgi:hypothetical protein